VANTVAARSTDQSGHLNTMAYVDDDECDRTTVSRLLGKSGQFRSVALYSSAEEALREVPRGQLQLVLMDIRMPGMSGFKSQPDCVAASANSFPSG